MVSSVDESTILMTLTAHRRTDKTGIVIDFTGRPRNSETDLNLEGNRFPSTASESASSKRPFGGSKGIFR